MPPCPPGLLATTLPPVLSTPPTGLDECFLTPWLLDFHAVQFSSSSGVFCLFLNLLLSFFWLCKEAKCIYLCLHLGQKLVFLRLFASVCIYHQTAIIFLVFMSSFYSFNLVSLAIKLLLVVQDSKILIPSVMHYF